MTVAVFYGIGLIAIAFGAAGLYMALIQSIPVKWLYHHLHVKKGISWLFFMILVTWANALERRQDAFPLWTIVPLLLTLVGVFLSYRMHQSVMFRAVDNPETTTDLASLPIDDEAQVGIIEYNGVTKAYALDYVKIHHIVNDVFGDKLVSLTYCANCRTIIPFDVTDLGPLFVGSFKNGNMILADRATRTFFQQATFESIIGERHPTTLTMVPLQVLPWKDVKALSPAPQVAKVSKHDLREFTLPLPIPGLWEKIMNSEATPGIAEKNRDKAFPARTRVIGVIDADMAREVAYLKEEVVAAEVVDNDELQFVLVCTNDAVNGFRNVIDGSRLKLALRNGRLFDEASGTEWDARGKHVSGPMTQNLTGVSVSDEYWFSWKQFHRDAQLIRLS